MKKILLDNLKYMGYPFRIAERTPAVDFMDFPCINREVQSRIDERIRTVATILKKIADKEGFKPPLIAGGVVRDMVFGVFPRDIDIFVDVSGMDEDEKEDFTALLAYDVSSEMVKTVRDLNWDKTIIKVGNTNYGNTTDLAALYVYAPGQLWFGAVNIDDLTITAETQVIAKNAPTIRENPNKFVEEFDYGLVRAWFDPSTMEYGFHQSFLDCMEQEKIIIPSKANEKTRIRIDSWIERAHIQATGKFLAFTEKSASTRDWFKEWGLKNKNNEPTLPLR